MLLRSTGKGAIDLAAEAGATWIARMGSAGEKAVIAQLERAGCRDMLAIRNAAHQGLDIVCRMPDGGFLVVEVKSSLNGAALAKRVLPANQRNMDEMCRRVLSQAANGRGPYRGIDAETRRRAQELWAIYRRNQKDVQGAVAKVDMSTGAIRAERWLRDGD